MCKPLDRGSCQNYVPKYPEPGIALVISTRNPDITMSVGRMAIPTQGSSDPYHQQTLSCTIRIFNLIILNETYQSHHYEVIYTLYIDLLIRTDYVFEDHAWRSPGKGLSSYVIS